MELELTAKIRRKTRNKLSENRLNRNEPPRDPLPRRCHPQPGGECHPVRSACDVSEAAGVHNGGGGKGGRRGGRREGGRGEHGRNCSYCGYIVSAAQDLLVIPSASAKWDGRASACVCVVCFPFWLELRGGGSPTGRWDRFGGFRCDWGGLGGLGRGRWIGG